MKPLPIGISTFPAISQGNYLYIDKTKSILQILNHPQKIYFLSRPLGCGKTLLVSTIKTILEGHRDLFKGLWIETSNYNWKTCPIIHLDLKLGYSPSPEEFQQELSYLLKSIAEQENLSSIQAPNIGLSFKLLIDKIYTKHLLKPAILIDSFDAPFIRGNNKRDELIKLISILFSGIIRAEQSRGVTLITGEGELPGYPYVSIFGYNVVNINRDPDLTDVCGITKKELFSPVFKDYLEYVLSKVKLYLPERRSTYKFSKITTILELKEAILHFDIWHPLNIFNILSNPYSLVEQIRSAEFLHESAEREQQERSEQYHRDHPDERLDE
jgi:hypothetical protein